MDKAFAELNAFWKGLLSKFEVEAPDPHVARMANTWNQYQCMATFNLSRAASMYETGIGRGMGFRDSNQDLLGFVHMIPSRARQRILDIAHTAQIRANAISFPFETMADGTILLKQSRALTNVALQLVHRCRQQSGRL